MTNAAYRYQSPSKTSFSKSWISITKRVVVVLVVGACSMDLTLSLRGGVVLAACVVQKI